MSKNSFTNKIMKLINKSRYGLTRPEIYKLVSNEYENTAESIAVYLSLLVRRGRLRVDDKRDCECCGKPYTVYRLTDKEKMWLAE